MFCALFGYTNESTSLEYFYKKSYQKWSTVVKTLKKCRNAPTRIIKKSQILLHKVFLKGEMTFPNNLVEGVIFENICRGNQKGETRGREKVIGRWDFFIFIFSLSTMMETDTSKSS